MREGHALHSVTASTEKVIPMTGTHAVAAEPWHHPRLAWAAVATAAGSAVLFAIGLAVLAKVGFTANDEDFSTWQVVVVSTGLFGGMAASAIAFVLAVVEKVRHDRWALLWLPLLLGPVLIVSFPFWFE